jgi:hypothetical protein
MKKIEERLLDELQGFKFDVFEFGNVDDIIVDATKTATYVSIPFKIQILFKIVEKRQFENLLNAVHQKIKNIKDFKVFGIQKKTNNGVYIEFFY